MDLIAAVDRNFALGKKGDLLFHIPEDMKYFRSMTMEKRLVLGSATLRSFPGGKPLKGRQHLLLSRQEGPLPENVQRFASLEALLAHLHTTGDEDVMVIGGAQVYRQLLPYCKKAYITRVEAEDPEADCFLENLEALPRWRLLAAGEEKEHEGLKFRFSVYENTAVAALV